MSNKINSIKDLCEFIWYLEDKHNLLNFEVDNVKVWQYLRMEIYYLLAKDLDILEQRRISQQSASVVLKNSFTLVKNLFVGNPFLAFYKQKDILVFTHNRSKIVDDKLEDIYTTSLIRDLRSSKKSYLCFEKPYLGRHNRRKKSDTKYLDFIISTSIIYGMIYQIKNKSSLGVIRKVELEIENYTGNSIDLTKLLKKNIGRYKLGYILYLRLFKRLNPKVIYSVASYSYLGDMISAAKKLGIETIELQHGVVSKYHMGYSFPNKQSLLCYSNVFYSWGDFWNKSVVNAFDDLKVKGFPYFRNNSIHYQLMKKTNKVLVLSQTALGEKIMNEMLKLINLFSDFQISYKLHPAEYFSYKKYSAYSKLSEYENVTFCLDCNLYQLMSVSKIQIGVFSTALFEGLAFSCKTYLLNLNGIEYMKDLLDAEYAKILSSDEIFDLKDIKETKIKNFF